MALREVAGLAMRETAELALRNVPRLAVREMAGQHQRDETTDKGSLKYGRNPYNE